MYECPWRTIVPLEVKQYSPGRGSKLNVELFFIYCFSATCARVTQLTRTQLANSSYM
jgi:hypothetical protein